MINKEVMYSLRDISIVPGVISSIKSRKECNPFKSSINESDNFLPIITAPMSCVLGENNWKEYEEAKINVIIPRTVDLKTRLDLFEDVFCAFSLSEAKDILNFPEPTKKYHVLIDIANGHMEEQIKVGESLKKKFGNKISLMGGNIANPKTYTLYDNAGFDFLRAGIGGGNCCMVKGTEISLPNGKKEIIEKLKKGDKVLTKNGVKVITEVFNNGIKEKTLLINNKLRCTEDHLIFVINKEDKDKVTETNLDEFGYFIKAEDLDKDKHLLVKYSESFSMTCKICNKQFTSSREHVVKAIMTRHLKESHQISVEDYLVKYELDGSHPKCLCGCGKDVGINGWAWNKYYADSHVGIALNEEAEIQKKAMLETKKKNTTIDLKKLYEERYDIDLIKQSADDFISKNYTLEELERKYKLDKRTLHKIWTELSIIPEDKYNEIIEYNKYIVSSEKLHEKFGEPSNIYAGLFYLMKEHPQKYTIYSLINEYNKNVMDKIINHPTIIYKNLKKIYGDIIDTYLATGYHSKEEYDYYNILKFFHKDWNIVLGFKIPKSSFIYDIAINSKLIIEYDSKEKFHSSKEDKLRDKEKEELAIKNGYIFKRLTFDEIKNIETLKLIEEWLNLKK